VADPTVPKGVSRPSDPAARRDWRNQLAAPYIPHPEPEVRARQAQPSEIPRGAKVITRVAEANGWSVAASYARGTSMHANGKPGRLVESCLLGMTREADKGRVVATWHDNSFDLSYASRNGETAQRLGARELRAFVEVPLSTESTDESTGEAA
jgi:hypothetical protein